MSDLPPFSGLVAYCPKCRSADEKTVYHATSFGSCRLDVSGEHLCRHCGNCGYLWAEQCADADVGEGLPGQAPDGRADA